jgi:hypothetical protein
MIKPVYNLLKKKTKMKYDQSPSSFGGNIMRPITPKPEFQAPVGDIEDKQTRFNNKTVVFAVIGAVLLAVLYYGGKKIGKGNEKDKSQKKNEDALLAENERYNMEMEEYENKRKQLLLTFQGFSRERNDVIKILQHNYKSAKLNNEDFQNMFSEKKLDSASSMEGNLEDENIDTAFMLKEDLEKKKMDMIESGKKLGQQKDNLLKQMQQVNQKLDEVANIYNSSYDGEKLPLSTQKPPQQQQQQQQPTHEPLK